MTWATVALTTATVYSADQQSNAIRRAGNIQAGAAGTATAESARQFDITQQNLQPFQEAGVGALGQQQALLGLSGEEAQQQAFSGLQESPGQQFIRNRQQRALVRNASAIGGLGGGNIRGALQQQAAGFASQDISNQFNRLSSLTGGGQTAATQIGVFGQQAVGQQGQFGLQAAQAQASGILGQQQVQSQLVGNLAQIGGSLAGRNQNFSQPIPQSGIPVDSFINNPRF
jgi:hypothetical protein